MKANFFCLAGILAALSFLLPFDVSAQSVPPLINYQGQIANPDGTPLPTADYELTFRIYDAPQGGTLIWGPQIFNGQSQPGYGPKIPVVQSYFNVMLGPVDTDGRLLRNAFEGSVRFLEISVSNRFAILPRQQILSAPFALKAGNSDKLAGFDWSSLLTGNDPVNGRLNGEKIANESITATQLAPDSVGASEIVPGSITDPKVAPGLAVPIGGVIMWWGAVGSMPTNFEICNGLVAHTPGAILSGRKPDLRDRFPKGALDGTSDVKSSPVIGGTHTVNDRKSGGTAITVSQMPSHTHPLNDPGHSHNQTVSGFYTAASGNQGVRPVGTSATSASVTGITIANTGGGQAHDHAIPGHDNRPVFIEMFFIIRVK